MKIKSNINLFLILVFIKLTGIISVPHEFCLEQFNDDDCGESPTLVFYYYKAGSRCEIRTWRGCPTLNKFPDEYLCSHYCIGKMLGRNDYVDLVEPILEKAAVTEWMEELETLEINDVEAIEKILDEVVHEHYAYHTLSYIKANKTEKEATSEESTEAQTEGITETVTEVVTEVGTEVVTDVTKAVTEAITEVSTEAPTMEVPISTTVAEAQITTEEDNSSTGSPEEVIIT